MELLTEMNMKLARSVWDIGERYSAGADQPLRGYATTMTVYGALVAVFAAVARMTGRTVPGGLSTADVMLSAAATHKLSRLLTAAGPAESAGEPAGAGPDETIGELVTCPFCAEVWIGTGLTAGLVFLPRLTRLVMATFAALAGADVLYFAHTCLVKSVD